MKIKDQPYDTKDREQFVTDLTTKNTNFKTAKDNFLLDIRFCGWEDVDDARDLVRLQPFVEALDLRRVPAKSHIQPTVQCH